MKDDWMRLAVLLDDDPESRDAVAEAADTSADMLSALVDALDDSGALAYMEWSDSGPELADALAQLPRVFGTGMDVDEIGDEAGSLEQVIVRADALLAPHGLRVLYLDEGSEACPLVVVAASRAEEIVTRASRLGITVRIFE